MENCCNYLLDNWTHCSYLVWSTDKNYISPGAALNTLSPHKQATIFTSSEKNIHTDIFIITDRISEIGITKGIFVFLKTTTWQVVVFRKTDCWLIYITHPCLHTLPPAVLLTRCCASYLLVLAYIVCHIHKEERL
jgi:hypothetical protein